MGKNLCRIICFETVNTSSYKQPRSQGVPSAVNPSVLLTSKLTFGKQKKAAGGEWTYCRRNACTKNFTGKSSLKKTPT